MKKLSKTEAEKEIKEFFSDIQNQSPEKVKKIKKLAMKYNLKLKDYKKKFCRGCFSPYENPKIRIHKGVKSMTCKNCGEISRYKIKTS